MRRLRRIHAAIALLAGLALAASLYGFERAAIVLLVIIVIALVVSAEALRVLTNREKRS